MGRITKRKQALIEDTKEEMKKKISFTKSFNRIQVIEKELIRNYKEMSSAEVAALRAVMDSCWKKIDKFVPNAKETGNVHDGVINVIVNRGEVAIEEGSERLTISHEEPEIELN